MLLKTEAQVLCVLAALTDASSDLGFWGATTYALFQCWDRAAWFAQYSEASADDDLGVGVRVLLCVVRVLPVLTAPPSLGSTAVWHRMVGR